MYKSRFPPNFSKAIDYDSLKNLPPEAYAKKRNFVELCAYREMATCRIVHICRKDALNFSSFVRVPDKSA